jgi:hypothetical protein
MKLKIISGGQTGADLGGLRAAKSHNIETGGCAARGFKTENGVLLELQTLYHLEDLGCSYAERTRENVRDASMTLIFADNIKSAGTKLTISVCNEFKRPYKINPAAYVVENLITRMNHVLPEDAEFVINIAGNRESVAPGIQDRTENILNHAFHMVKYKIGGKK